MSDITIRESWENFSAECYFSKPYPNSDGSKCYKDPNIPKCEQTTCVRLMAHRMYVENRKRDAAPDMYALLDDLESIFGDPNTSGSESECAYDIVIKWLILRARINGEVEI